MYVLLIHAYLPSYNNNRIELQTKFNKNNIIQNASSQAMESNKKYILYINIYKINEGSYKKKEGRIVFNTDATRTADPLTLKEQQEA